MMLWDLINIGKEHTTLGRHRYISIFIVHSSCFVITILHKDSKNFKEILQSAFTKACFTPKRICCNGANNGIPLHWGPSTNTSVAMPD